MPGSYDFKLVHKEKAENAIMLFHGMTGSPFEMKKYANFLYKSGFDVYCYCLPGHGNHPITINSVSWEDWISFSCEKYENLKQKYKKFFLGGLCLGAVIALKMAQDHDDISGVISLSTTLYLDGWTIPWYNFLMPMGLYTIVRYYYTFPEREPYGIKNKITRKTISKLMGKNSVAMDNYPLSCIYELLQLSKHARKNMYKVKAPVLIIHSNEDDLTSIKSAKFVYNNISSEKKELIILDNSYHLVVYDNDKDLVYNKSVDFLKSLSSTILQEVPL